MKILKYLIAFGLSAIISNAYATDIYKIKTSMGILSLAKKSLKENDPIWTLKLDNKLLREFENTSDSNPHFMTALGNSAAFWDLPDNAAVKPVIVDSTGEVMAVVVGDFNGNACEGSAYSMIFIVFIKTDGTFKSLDVPNDCTLVNKASVQGKRLELDIKGLTKPLVYESGELKTLAVPAPPAKPVYKDVDAAKKAFQCVKKARGDCPYFSTVYEGDSDFRKGLQASFKDAGFTIPEWDMDAPMTPILIGEEPYIYGDTWSKFSESPGNDKIEVLYSLQRKVAVGLFYVEDYDHGKWFGNPTEKEQQVLKDARDQSGKNPIGKAIADGPFPVIVKPKNRN